MEIQLVIEQLKAASKPSRSLDSMIAKALRFRHFQKTNERAAYWLSPDGEEVKIPRYTSSLDAAYGLATEHAPSAKGGASWDEKTGAASVGSVGYHVAANTAIAICMATLDALAQKDRQ